MAATANVALATDTFNTWLTKTNEIIYKVNGITKSANTIQANTSAIANEGSYGGLLTLTGGFLTSGATANVSNANTNILGGTLLVTSNTNMFGVFTGYGNVNVTGTMLTTGPVNLNGANTNIRGGSLLVTSNTNITGSLSINGTAVVAGDPASDALAFAIALG